MTACNRQQPDLTATRLHGRRSIRPRNVRGGPDGRRRRTAAAGGRCGGGWRAERGAKGAGCGAPPVVATAALGFAGLARSRSPATPNHQSDRTSVVRRSRPRRATRPAFVDVGRDLFFTADDGVHGRELWVRTAPRRRAGQGRAPGASYVGRLQPDRGGDLVFFTADDGRHGNGCGSPTAPAPAPCWSATSPATTTTYGGPASLTAVGDCSSPPTTGPTGGAVALRRHPRRDRAGQDIDPDDSSYGASGQPDRRRRHALLHRRRRVPQPRLWTSDGTKSGTVWSTTSAPGLRSAVPGPLSSGRDLLRRPDGVHGRAVDVGRYRHAGTRLVPTSTPAPATPTLVG